MSRGKRQLATSTTIPLSGAPRGSRVLPKSFKEKHPPIWAGSFEFMIVSIVNLHATGTWELAKTIAKDKQKIYFKHDLYNEVDENAVQAFVDQDNFLGYVERENAPILARALDAGAPLYGRAYDDTPHAGKNTRGGALIVEVGVE